MQMSQQDEWTIWTILIRFFYGCGGCAAYFVFSTFLLFQTLYSTRTVISQDECLSADPRPGPARKASSIRWEISGSCCDAVPSRVD